jgi:hypothetical protein
MVLTGETRNTRRNTFPGLLCPPHLTWTDLESNSVLRGDRPATNRLSYDTAKVNGNLNYT